MRLLRFLTLMLVALTLGMTFSHLLQMPAKFAYPAPTWLLLQQTLYGNFRALGGPIETGALACALVLTLAARSRHPAFRWTLFGTVCLLGAHAAWWLGAMPVNAKLAQYTAHTLPADWMVLRVQWEYAHVVRTVLQAAALGALLYSILAETPRRVL